MKTTGKRKERIPRKIEEGGTEGGKRRSLEKLSNWEKKIANLYSR